MVDVTRLALVCSFLFTSAIAAAQPGAAAASPPDAPAEMAPPEGQDASEEGTRADETARRVYLEGRDAFEEGRYEDALRLFETAYELSGRPELLYNIGTTADRLRRNRRALEAFERFLEARPDSEYRPAVEARVRVIRAELEREEELQRTLQQAEQRPPEEPRRRWWIGVLVGGLVVAATAVALGVALRDDDPQYLTGDEGRLVFTLERTP